MSTGRWPHTRATGATGRPTGTTAPRRGPDPGETWTQGAGDTSSVTSAQSEREDTLTGPPCGGPGTACGWEQAAGSRGRACWLRISQSLRGLPGLHPIDGAIRFYQLPAQLPPTGLQKQPPPPPTGPSQAQAGLEAPTGCLGGAGYCPSPAQPSCPGLLGQQGPR